MLSLKEECSLKVVDNRIVGRRSGPNRKCRRMEKMHSEELHNSYFHQILLGLSNRREWGGLSM
jgi:hypothetical protein